MMLYVVVTDKSYGGHDDVKVFSQFNDAVKYSQNGCPLSDCLIIDQHLDVTATHVFALVHDDLYGGENMVKVYATEQEALDWLPRITHVRYHSREDCAKMILKRDVL